MIVMVGCPASGKSSYVKNVIVPKGYAYVNRDTLKTPAKCLSAAENALQNKQSVRFDTDLILIVLVFILYRNIKLLYHI
jgi:bifunctional polynucleotide phosphatase/kinase